MKERAMPKKKGIRSVTAQLVVDEIDNFAWSVNMDPEAVGTLILDGLRLFQDAGQWKALAKKSKILKRIEKPFARLALEILAQHPELAVEAAGGKVWDRPTKKRSVKRKAAKR